MTKSQPMPDQKLSKEVLELRFNHKQPEIWAQAFSANARVWKACWALLFLLALSFALNIVQAGRPANVIIVDKLGQAEFYHEAASPEPPQDYEAKHFAEYWLKLFLSRDAITAKEDLAQALTLMNPKLQDKIRTRLIDSGELDKLRDAYVHSTIRCTDVQISKTSKDRKLVEVTGIRIFTALDSSKKKLSEPFHFQLVLDAVSRTEQTPNGLMVRFISGKWGNENINENEPNQPG